MTSRWAGPLLLAGGLVVGCGTRTALLDYENAAGSGGSAGSAGTGGVAGSGGATGGMGGVAGGSGGSGGTAGYAGTAGVGGSGGMNPACDELVLNGYAIGFEPTPWANQDTPILAPIDDIGPRVAIAVVETPAESPGPVPANLRMATFDAWGDWSAVSLGNGAYPSFVVGVDQVAMDRGATDGRVAVAYPGAPSPPAYEPTTLFLTSELNPDAPNGQYVSDITTMTADSHLVRFVRRGSWGHLVGLQRRSGEHYGLDLTLVNPEIPEGFVATDMGCATAPMVADAAPVPSGFVYAFSSSREFGGCLLDDGVDGPPSRIHVGAYSNLEMYYSMLPLGFSMDDVVQFVRLVPHSDGTWLVFQYAGINAEVPPPIQVVRFGNDGTVLDGPFDLSDFGIIYSPPAVGRLGDRLVFAWVDAYDPFGGTIMMAVVGSGGEITIKTSYSVPDAASVLPKLSVLGSPSADQFVLGWSQWGTTGEMLTEARIAQFSCW